MVLGFLSTTSGIGWSFFEQLVNDLLLRSPRAPLPRGTHKDWVNFPLSGPRAGVIPNRVLYQGTLASKTGANQKSGREHPAFGNTIGQRGDKAAQESASHRISSSFHPKFLRDSFQLGGFLSSSSLVSQFLSRKKPGPSQRSPSKHRRTTLAVIGASSYSLLGYSFPPPVEDPKSGATTWDYHQESSFRSVGLRIPGDGSSRPVSDPPWSLDTDHEFPRYKDYILSCFIPGSIDFPRLDNPPALSR
ncbi:hypothetical protein P692DRAFT_20882733 [Suillus brevipes Sb2]|nr:hypothetical protein P692DRAFT_20882733 [Suillus brevipes Sb2]